MSVAAAPARDTMTTAEFSAQVAPIRARLVRTARAIVHDHTDAEEIVQNALLSAWLNLGKFERRARFTTWVISIVVNKALDMRRHRAYLNRRTAEMPKGYEIPSGQSIEREAISEQEAAAVRAAVAALPPMYREALTLRMDKETPFSRVPVDKSRVHRAIKMLRADLHFLALFESRYKATGSVSR